MTQELARIAVVEDEPDLREVVVEYLCSQRFHAIPCPDAAALDAALAEAPVAAVLLDLNLPHEGGLSIARRLRERADAPGILMVTALGESTDRIVGLELGADDYIGKPFELRELLARLRSVLRRRAATQQAAPPAAPLPVPEIRFAGFALRPAERRLLGADGAEVALTPMEFDLLLMLASRPREVHSRDDLLRQTHGKEPDPLDRSIDIRITRLRRKLETDPANPRLILTARGQGYRFDPDA
jgi:two-component system phosphate regulon response regulator OmpR